MSDFITPAGFVALPMLSGVCSGLATDSKSIWYLSLRKPSFQPSPKVFPIVWPTLYACMGIASYRVWMKGGWNKQKRALSLYLAQLALNLAWSPLFFGMHRADLSLINIAALWPTIAATIFEFKKADQPAALLMVPYLAWTTFAAILNASIVKLNPHTRQLQ